MAKAVEVLESAFSAIDAGNFETYTGLLHPEMQLTVPGRSRFAKTYKGLEETMAFFGSLDEASDGTFKHDSQSVYGDDSTAVCVYKMSAVRNGRKFEWNQVNVYQVRDGKIADVQSHIHQQYEFDQFWG